MSCDNLVVLSIQQFIMHNTLGDNMFIESHYHSMLA